MTGHFMLHAAVLQSCEFIALAIIRHSCNVVSRQTCTILYCHQDHAEKLLLEKTGTPYTLWSFTKATTFCLQVRGKTVYLQYSTRQEIVNSTRSAEQGGNVLLVSLENLAVSQPCF